MSSDVVREGEFAGLFRRATTWIDVRAPVEFAEGSVPGAVNLPLLSDEERAAVGTTYKREGQAAAVALGHELVSGAVKDARVGAWLAELRRHPDAILFCFRGGLRSQITRRWIAEAGARRPLVEGGFKALRRFLREEIEKAGSAPFVVVAGATGSGKTEFLHAAGPRVLDLEGAANHRGSAFGARPGGQPAQVDFENRVAVDWLRLPAGEGAILVEDESRMIGRRVVPEGIFASIRTSPLVLLVDPIEARVERILRDYVREPLAAAAGASGADPGAAVFDGFEAAVGAIEKRLGGLRATEIRADLRDARAEWLAGRGVDRNREWIRKLLQWYYDPLYERGLERRDSKILYRGGHAGAREWWREHVDRPAPAGHTQAR